jgi:acyl-CoA thioesterase FadM
MSEGDVDGVGVILTDLQVSYRSEAFFGQMLRVEIAAESPSRRGVTLLYRVTDAADGRVVALAATGLLFFDYDTRRPALMPGRFRERLGGA